MITLAQTNEDRLKQPHWESQLKRLDQALFIRYDEIKSRWMVFEYYPENVYIKPLLWLEDGDGKPKEFGQWVFNKLNVMNLNWQHKEKVGSNNWFDELAAGADEQKKQMEEEISKENLYMYKHDKLQWRKGKRELLNQPASDVFAGYPKIKGKDHAELIKLTDTIEPTEVRGTEGPCVQPDVGGSENAGQ